MHSKDLASIIIDEAISMHEQLQNPFRRQIRGQTKKELHMSSSLNDQKRLHYLVNSDPVVVVSKALRQ